MNRNKSGQSLIELVIGIAIGVLFITGALGVITVTLRLDLQNKYGQTAAQLAQELAEQTTVVANANWHDLDRLNHGSDNQYHLATQNGFLQVLPNSTTTLFDGQAYTVYLTIENVARGDNGQIITDGTGTNDPSTLKITATAKWLDKGETNTVIFSRYLTRDRDRIAVQKNWALGALMPSENPVTDFGGNFATSTNINFSRAGEITIRNLATSTPVGPYSNIDSTVPNFYAWNDVVGWIDFRSTNTVYVTSTQISGFATSSVGFIALNCDSVPPNSANICPPNGISQFGVLNNANNEGAGKLSGMAWNDNLGWISFKDTINQIPAYQVTIDQNTGDFHGFAWSDTSGWISFNCADTAAGCGTSSWRVRLNSGTPVAGTLTSLIYDTQQQEGAAPNAIVWQGTRPLGTRVRFLLATSNDANGPWDYLGPTGDSSVYYEANQNTSVAISRAISNNKRYLRYKVFLYSDPDRLTTPTINSISLNWSL